MGPRKLIRSAIERAGYRITPTAILPFGVDRLLDITRTARAFGIDVTCVFDIGAYDGDTARDYLARFPAASVHAFEPNPASFAALERLRSPRLQAHRLALSDRSGTAQLFVRSDGPGLSDSLVRRPQFAAVIGAASKSVAVERMTLDAFCASRGIANVDIVKIDTEGHEREVLDGGTETLDRRGVSFVLAEFNTVNRVDDADGGALAPIAEILEPRGFRLIATYPVLLTHNPLVATFDGLYFRAP